MSKRSLLLVDGDASSLRVLEVSLRKAGFNVTTALTRDDALQRVRTSRPDLVISATQIAEELDGFELCAELKSDPDWKAIPFIFVAEQDSLDEKIRGLELGVEEYLTKPLYIKEIITRVRILLQKRERADLEEKRDTRTRFTGSLGDMGVVDLLQTIELSRKSGLIHVTASHRRQATVYFRDGAVVDAEAGRLQGEDAVYRLLTWTEGSFEVLFRNVRRRDVIHMSTQGLLMEGMRRLDEWGRLLEQLPPVDTRFQLDFEELAIRLPDLPDELNSILRLFDGRRSLIDIIDESRFSDLEALEIISRLYFEGVISETVEGLEPPPVGRYDRMELGPSGLRPRTVPPEQGAPARVTAAAPPPPPPPSRPQAVPQPIAAASSDLIDRAIGNAGPVVDEESGRILAGVASFVAEATAVEVATWNETDDRAEQAAGEAREVLDEMADEVESGAWFRPKRPESSAEGDVVATSTPLTALAYAEKLEEEVAPELDDIEELDSEHLEEVDDTDVLEVIIGGPADAAATEEITADEVAPEEAAAAGEVTADQITADEVAPEEAAAADEVTAEIAADEVASEEAAAADEATAEEVTAEEATAEETAAEESGEDDVVLTAPSDAAESAEDTAAADAGPSEESAADEWDREAEEHFSPSLQEVEEGVPSPIEDESPLPAASGEHLADIVLLDSVRTRPRETARMSSHGGVVSSLGEDKAEASGELEGHESPGAVTSGPSVNLDDSDENDEEDEALEVEESEIVASGPTGSSSGLDLSDVEAEELEDRDDEEEIDSGELEAYVDEPPVRDRTKSEVLIPPLPPPPVTARAESEDGHGDDDLDVVAASDLARLRDERPEGGGLGWVVAAGGALLVGLLAFAIMSSDSREGGGAPAATGSPGGEHRIASPVVDTNSMEPQERLGQDAAPGPGAYLLNPGAGSETPNTETLGTEKPGTEKPGTETTEKPETEKPGTETTEKPGTEKPGTETTEKPGTEKPGTETIEKPGAEKPGAKKPGTEATEKPGAEKPDQKPGARARALLAEARKLRSRGDADGALAKLDEALALRRTGSSLVLKADLLLRKRDKGGALKAATEAVKLAPRSSSAWKTKGGIHLELGDNAAAKQAFKKYLELAPKAADRDDIQLLVDSL